MNVLNKNATKGQILYTKYDRTRGVPCLLYGLVLNIAMTFVTFFKPYL
jgi:hypothetical protein